jgi:hypothetical protein
MFWRNADLVKGGEDLDSVAMPHMVVKRHWRAIDHY